MISGGHGLFVGCFQSKQDFVPGLAEVLSYRDDEDVNR
jgi:hypothetical protein